MEGYILRGVQITKDANGKTTKDTIYVGTDGHTPNFTRALCSAFAHRKDAEEHVTRYTAMCNLPNGYEKDRGIRAHTDDNSGVLYFAGRLGTFAPITKWEILDISEILKEYKTYKECVDSLIDAFLAGRKLRYVPVKADAKKADALTSAWVLEQEIKTLADYRHSVNWMERERRLKEEALNAENANLVEQTKKVSHLISKIRGEFDEAAVGPELNDLVDRLQKKFNNIKHSERV